MEKKSILLSLAIGITIFYMGKGCSANLDYVKERAESKWKSQGFEIVDYEGYGWGFRVVPTYGGARVWHRLKKVPDNGITYSGFLIRWGDEIHVYGPEAIDAIKP